MLQTFILGSYRFVALLLVTSPIVLNFIFSGDVVTSLIYVPTSMLVLGFLAVYIDHEIEEAITKAQQHLSSHRTAQNAKGTQVSTNTCRYLEQLCTT